MCKRFIPFAHAKNLYDIEYSFLSKLGIKYLFLDLDNTLDSYRTLIPSERSKSFIAKIKEMGITPIIISNNRGTRVRNYATSLEVECLHATAKPFSFRLKRLIREKNINRDEVLMVGDQMITDVFAANGAKIKVILTDKLVKEDQWSTHINRFIEKPIRVYYNKHKLKDWRTI